MASIAYFILVRFLLTGHATDSVVAKAIGRDAKGIFSVVRYAAGIAIAFINS